MKQTHRWGGAILTGVLALGFTASPALAEEDQLASEAGMGALSAVSTLIYAPVKLLYAGCGLVFGGIAWGLSGGDSDVMMAVVTPAVRGDYVITPAHLRMEQKVEFFGQDPAYREAQHPQVAAEPNASSPAAIQSEDY